MPATALRPALSVVVLTFVGPTLCPFILLHFFLLFVAEANAAR
jgi:hypothetical protein